MTDDPAPQPADGQPTKPPGCLPWLLALLAVGAVFSVLGIGDDDQARTAATAPCRPAPAPLTDAIEAGLTVGGGQLVNGQMIFIPESKRNTNGWPPWFLGAQIISGSGTEAVGVWATSSEGGSVWAINQAAVASSDWGTAMNPGSPAWEIRETFQTYPEMRAVTDCVRSKIP